MAAMVMVVLTRRVDSEPTQDKQALLAFLSQVPHASRLRWNPNASACTWVGVECDADNTSVYSLRLPGVGLVGPIPPNTLGQLAGLRVLSLRSNRLSGSLPSDFSNLTLLRSLYLQDNNLSGSFPSSIPLLPRLTRVDLSTNNLTGPIPFSLNNLTKLTGLFLEKNGFSGPLPSLSQSSLVAFNVSDNNLNGSIPSSLSKFPSSAFAGNLHLCGGPLTPCSPFFPSPSPSPSGLPETQPVKKSKKKLSTAAIVAIAVGSAVFLILLLLLLFCCCRRRQRRQRKTQKPQPPGARSVGGVAGGDPGTSSSKDDVTGSLEGAGGERNKLVFFDGGVYSFDLEDLLRASAEVLGKGSVGTSYKAVLEEGTTVVVKRLKDVVVSKREFEVVMEGLGRVKHENVVPLRAYYFSKDEKLLVYDYMPAGSLSALLHGMLLSLLPLSLS
ncbi:hypothetical protein RHMOL_Rhmol01G0077700 [Rhododendron molle]|uniref:Uncharacterized protein n=1 Tax=Rhododendron molle TaxID=49168 RepID=A0ACC0Q0Y2_RHOML|nr:hypothetical protein RHMOL_Rhmol01G0077700 [Rhododendron molle]